MTHEYLAVLIQIVAAAVVAGGALAMSVILGKVGARSKAKDTPYECGLDPEGKSNPRFSVKFYLIAMLFILFDIEIVFLYPWAVVYGDMIKESWEIFGAMLMFQAVLAVGFVYEFKKGALDWSR